MDVILNEIEKALDSGLYYLALVSVLSLPDVCSALESPDGSTAGTQYKAWYDRWLAARYPRLTRDDIYRLRCGVVHQGRFGHPGMQYARVLFTLPNANRLVFHKNVISDALNLDAVTFCRDIVHAVREWYEDRKNDPVVKANLARLLKLYPDGLAPYIVGVPVIT